MKKLTVNELIDKTYAELREAIADPTAGNIIEATGHVMRSLKRYKYLSADDRKIILVQVIDKYAVDIIEDDDREQAQAIVAAIDLGIDTVYAALKSQWFADFKAWVKKICRCKKAE